VLQKDAKLELLRGVPLFAGCSKSELQQIAQLADELDLSEGATLIREGERGREFLVIAEGTVEVTRSGKAINQLGAGDFIGEIALVVDRPRTATVTATSHVRLLVVTDRAFARLLEQVPGISLKVMQSLGERLHADSL
jgi:CRP-like cAMP-binding protein